MLRLGLIIPCYWGETFLVLYSRPANSEVCHSGLWERIDTIFHSAGVPGIQIFFSLILSGSSFPASESFSHSRHWSLLCWILRGDPLQVSGVLSLRRFLFPGILFCELSLGLLNSKIIFLIQGTCQVLPRFLFLVPQARSSLKDSQNLLGLPSLRGHCPSLRDI